MDQSPTKEPTKAKKLPLKLRVIFNVIAVFIVIYKFIDYADLKTTSTLFIGLPIWIGLVTNNLVRTRGVYSLTVAITVIILCLIAPLLGEGSICILMMAPLFLALTLSIVLVYQEIKKYFMPVIICLPLVTGLIDKQTLNDPPVFSKFTTQTLVKGSVEQWQNDLFRKSLTISTNTPLFLRLGFPLPLKIIKQDHHQLIIPFDKGGVWEVTQTFGLNSINYNLTKDTSKINDWINIHSSSIEVTKFNDHQVLIRQTIHYQSKVFPKWYFVPFQKLAFRQIHKWLISSLERT